MRPPGRRPSWCRWGGRWPIRCAGAGSRAAWAALITEKLSQAAQGEAPASPDNATETILRVPGGTLGVTRLDDGPGKPVVVLAAIPGCAAGSAGLARAIAASRPVVCLDLPGIGASTLERIDLPGVVQALRAGLDQLGVTSADIVACEESAAIGCALAQGLPGSRLVLLNPVPDASRAALLEHMVDVSPRIDGAQLLAAWHQLRDRSLWRPWFERNPAHALPAGTDPDVPRLQAILTDWMRGGRDPRSARGSPLPPACRCARRARPSVDPDAGRAPMRW